MTMGRLARGLRNNNPGNIRRVRGQRWRGQCPEQQDPAFVQFTSPEWGYRAMMVILLNYRRKGVRTVRQIIRRWAPPQDGNLTEAYVGCVCDALGCTPNCIPDLSDRATMTALVAAMSRVENGVPADLAAVDRAFGLLDAAD